MRIRKMSCVYGELRDDFYMRFANFPVRLGSPAIVQKQ